MYLKYADTHTLFHLHLSQKYAPGGNTFQQLILPPSLSVYYLLFLPISKMQY